MDHLPTLPGVCGACRPSEHPDTPAPSWTLTSARTEPRVCLHSLLGSVGCGSTNAARPPQVSGGCEPLSSKFSCNTQAGREPAAPRQALLPEPPGSVPHPPKHPSLSAPAGPPHPFPPGRTGCVEEADGRQGSGEGGSGWDRPPTHRTRMRRRPVSVGREWTSPSRPCAYTAQPSVCTLPRRHQCVRPSILHLTACPSTHPGPPHRAEHRAPSPSCQQPPAGLSRSRFLAQGPEAPADHSGAERRSPWP